MEQARAVGICRNWVKDRMIRPSDQYVLDPNRSRGNTLQYEGVRTRQVDQCIPTGITHLRLDGCKICETMGLSDPRGPH